MIKLISVIIPTYNPNQEKLDLTIKHLEEQRLSKDRWELIIVDNNSSKDVKINCSPSLNYRLIKELRQGLTYARLAGIKTAKGELVVLVDDDNLLTPDYLDNAASIFAENLNLGAAGGKILPAFDSAPEAWLADFYELLAIRDLGEEVILASWEHTFPKPSPVGAGMILSMNALKTYLNKEHYILDRTGNSLSSGGDNDIVIEVLKAGWEVGYFPSLVLKHLIPASRTTLKYISKLTNESSKSWVILLLSHNICPWEKIHRYSVPIRKIRAWFAYKAWSNKTNYIKWKGACGIFDGLAT
ncbi:glycosyltransferase [Pedobacter frigidisoli]|uniref:glycosyltransferase n=1 Tax=Pedobacter frigidisoli TaxID=2530455 RepID=UPI00292F76D3|nr:glycosyltransferase [Pedobacter frigidisoli]